MFEKIQALIESIAKNKKAFTRILILIGLIVGGFILIQNVSCGYNRAAGFWFKWMPAIEKIEIKKSV